MSSKPGIRVRHSSGCPARDGGACTAGRKNGCRPSFEAWVWSPRDEAKIRRTFRNLAEAKGWRNDAASAIRKGALLAPTRQTVEEACRAWITDAKSGAIRKRNGERYKPSLIRTYEGDVGRYIAPALGRRRLLGPRPTRCAGAR